MAMEQTISQIQENLRKGLFPNEAAVTTGAVLPILNDLGWQVFDPSVVFPQYKVETQFKREKRFVDFALLRPNGNPTIFVEAKKVGAAASGEMQLFEYAFHKGVPPLWKPKRLERPPAERCNSLSMPSTRVFLW